MLPFLRNVYCIKQSCLPHPQSHLNNLLSLAMGLYKQHLCTTRWLGIWPCFSVTAARTILDLYNFSSKRLVAGKQSHHHFSDTGE